MILSKPYLSEFSHYTTTSEFTIEHNNYKAMHTVVRLYKPKFWSLTKVIRIRYRFKDNVWTQNEEATELLNQLKTHFKSLE
jgi:hypothetical protein